MDTVTSPPPLRSLTTRSLDFWMLGGASLVLWAVMFTFEGDGREAWAINHHFLNLVALSGSLALICNYPHFMASYRLVYGQGGRFILEHWFQLLVVPICLLVALWGMSISSSVSRPCEFLAPWAGLYLDRLPYQHPQYGREEDC